MGEWKYKGSSQLSQTTAIARLASEEAKKLLVEACMVAGSMAMGEECGGENGGDAVRYSYTSGSGGG